MTHQIARLIAALATGATAAAALRAGHDDRWLVATAYAAITVMLFAFARHEQQCATAARLAAVHAHRVERLRRPPADPPDMDWCCELWLLTNAAVHTPGCPEEWS
ncbi:hypothetical protein [Streptomyces sp. NPDC001404]|uniref:hypothetical protein n=1 Tax=Streptomyces sp. NPDC001404 TaxID=3364571 RepID=UPI00367F4E32